MSDFQRGAMRTTSKNFQRGKSAPMRGNRGFNAMRGATEPRFWRETAMPRYRQEAINICCMFYNLFWILVIDSLIFATWMVTK